MNTHGDVLEILKDTHPEISKLILCCDKKRNCWSDLIMQAQHKFDYTMISSCFERLYNHGYEKYIIEAWCPYTINLWKVLDKIYLMVDEYKQMNKEEKMKHLSELRKAIDFMRSLRNIERNGWLRKNNITSVNDINFFSKIINHLKINSKD